MEVTQESRVLRSGNFPDTEEAENMVNSEGMEVVRLAGEALTPPAEVIQLHSLPVVGGEAPILPVSSEVIGRSSCRLICVEEARGDPDIYAMRCYSDGEVALEEDFLLLGIATHRP